MKPILFNTEMVRAILEGRKTVTRRVISRDIVNNCDMEKDGTLLDYQDCYGDFINPVALCRYKVNDVLYVRETWCKLGKLDEFEQHIDGTDEYYYRADGSNPTPYNYFIICGERREYPKWYPSIHMPKEAARLFLRVTDVRVERLQDMTTKEDFKKEGIYDDGTYPTDRSVKIHPMAQGGWTLGAYKDRFEMIWNSTIKRDQLNTYSWEANPYVWVIEFEVIPKEVATEGLNNG